VLAGRDPPAAPWQIDPGWRQLVAVHRLDPFDLAESGELLAHAGVAPPLRHRLVTLGRGHPLTMALLGDLAASGEVPDTLAEAPDLISALQWLTRRPFVTAGPRGLFTHDLARDVLDAEFQRRTSERYRTTRWTIYTHAVAGLRGGTDLDRPLHAQQLGYLLRISPVADTIAGLDSGGNPGRPLRGLQ
jgi:hypothetical protein